jgi:hypothetical protein
MDNDAHIAAWIRRTEALAERLMVPPAEVYETLIERGYTGNRLRETVPVDRIVSFVAALFRPEEVLGTPEVVLRYQSKPNPTTHSDNLQRYIKQILVRNCDDRGLRRFKRVRHGVYRLQLSNPELRAAMLDELTSQRAFVSSKRLMELFDVSYERLHEVLVPIKDKVVSCMNETTKSRDWCMTKYARIFEE